MTTKKVYSAIAEVTAELAKKGVGKDQTNSYDNYKFRGIDDVYNALAPLLAKHKLCVLPNVLDREVVERVNQKGTALFYVTVKVEYHFVSAEDGSSHIVGSVGEAMDRGDKATNKAMSAAYKYACFQAFCIPTEGDNDSETETHEVKAQARPHPNSKEAQAAKQALREANPHIGLLVTMLNDPSRADEAAEFWRELRGDAPSEEGSEDQKALRAVMSTAELAKLKEVLFQSKQEQAA